MALIKVKCEACNKKMLASDKEERAKKPFLCSKKKCKQARSEQ